MPQDTAATTTSTEVTSDQRRHLADAITVEVSRIVAKKTKQLVDAGDAQLLQKVAANAVTFATTPAPAAGDEKAQKAAARKLAALNAQLANIEAIGASVASDTFWQVVTNVIGRMSTFVLTTAIAAV